ncbi:unnamed protein product, partial [Callosobruchus maculatus]
VAIRPCAVRPLITIDIRLQFPQKHNPTFIRYLFLITAHRRIRNRGFSAISATFGDSDTAQHGKIQQLGINQHVWIHGLQSHIRQELLCSSVPLLST